MAASTWSHSPWRPATSAMAPTGSSAVEVVVPVVATTAQGRRPASRSTFTAASSASGRRAWRSSASMARTFVRPKPASSAAFSTELWLWREA